MSLPFFITEGVNIDETTVSVTSSELGLLNGITATTAELNILDGNTSATSTTVADADRVVLNDGGTMKQVAVTNLATYFNNAITSVGALNSGSITSGFGAIDNGADIITTTGAITGGTLNGLYVKSGGTEFNHSILLRGDSLPTSTLSNASNTVGLGNGVFDSLTNGKYNTCIGTRSGYAITEGGYNTCIGSLVGLNIITGNYNTCNGMMSGYNINTGLNNTCIGSVSGYAITQGDYNTCIGSVSDVNLTDAQNQIVIGYNATGQGDKYAVIGNADIERLYAAQDGQGVLHAAAAIITSDSRIKSNIVDIDDSSALQQVRDIPCRYYNYIDTARRGTEQTPGFIAQEVEAVFPLAVSTDTNYIPNEYRLLTNYTLTETTTLIDTNNTTKGNYWKLTINDLTDLSTTNRYRIKVSNDTTFDLNNGKNESKYITAIDGEQTSFLLEEQWTHIFLYGKEVNDFKRIDKAKIFTLHHSAIQQIDKTLTEEQAKTTALESDLAAEKGKTATLQTELDSEKAKILTLQNELSAIKTHLGL